MVPTIELGSDFETPYFPLVSISYSKTETTGNHTEIDVFQFFIKIKRVILRNLSFRYCSKNDQHNCM